MEKKVGNSKLILKLGDITKEKVDAIVNAANSRLAGGGGVDGAIHRAGGPKIMEECREIINKIGVLPPGEAVATTAGNLPAKYVIHTVGPIYRGGQKGEENTLRNAYLNSLKLAKQLNVRTIAFPSISTGAYGYPVKDAARVALKAVIEFLEGEPEDFTVVFLLFDEITYAAYKEALEAYLK
ncbi:O-acetyl-ADP-ribose deacetylase [Carboxydothermus ferrireducens]|uniref:O-acetyl-ADP-ribose deacetylase (Regulator of RNase III) n=1 Tax=Carboxydothermus ferrireducens DSM 11255 TaxID=1119529 RepID=A0ABX2R8P8_9THEO|nr:O-acetyl-ADP-ribose deacetylase [Carboxydothermus ferrireducens]NYE56473.1 O-acetyl-ADP-ribose deacetylase (regulator of RNase III) [Carboxydothermus ferrireducens DSM 11255]